MQTATKQSCFCCVDDRYFRVGQAISPEGTGPNYGRAEAAAVVRTSARITRLAPFIGYGYWPALGKCRKCCTL